EPWWSGSHLGYMPHTFCDRWSILGSEIGTSKWHFWPFLRPWPNFMVTVWVFSSRRSSLHLVGRIHRSCSRNCFSRKSKGVQKSIAWSQQKKGESVLPLFAVLIPFLVDQQSVGPIRIEDQSFTGLQQTSR